MDVCEECEEPGDLYIVRIYCFGAYVTSYYPVHPECIRETLERDEEMEVVEKW